VLNISPDLVELLGVPNPVVEGLVLPERSTCARKQNIGAARRPAFHESRDGCQFNPWSQQQVDVIGHHHEGMQRIPATGTLAEVYHDTLRNIGASKPLGPVLCSIQQQIASSKRAPIIGAFVEGRKRSGETPGNEYCRPRGMPMREIASIHRFKEVENVRNFLLVFSRHNTG
jgi:hypothetical protein